MNEPYPSADPFARLRRAFESTDPEVEAFAEHLGRAYRDALPAGYAEMWERVVTELAQAAEELGPDASVAEINQRARQLAKRRD